jgi:hypothetical protein
MKRHDLIRLPVDGKCVLERHGANHDIYLNVLNRRKAPIPRHNEIKDSLARLILKQLGIE